MHPAAQKVHSGEQAAVAAQVRSWSIWNRVLFRFTSSYLILYLSYAIVTYAAVPVPVLRSVSAALWNALTDRVGIALFHFDQQDMARLPEDSGDILAGLVFLFCTTSLAMITTVVWSVVDRRRRHYDELHGWLRVIVRYTLFLILFDYGINKVFPLQFSPPEPSTLLKRYGEFTTFDVLWEFMGVSQPYTIFCGVAEVVGALLLLFRGTTTLGAMVCSAALLNVVMLNCSYDIGVKMYSLHLLLMAMFLLLADIKPVAQLLLFRRAATPSRLPDPLFESRWGRLGSRVIWAFFVGLVLYTQIGTAWWYFERKYINSQRLPMYGAYEVETFIRNGREVPMADTFRWQKVIIDNSWGGSKSGSLHVRVMDDQPDRTVQFRFGVEHDAAKKVLILGRTGGHDRRTLAYSSPDANHLVLSGAIQQGAVWMRLRKLDTSQLRLAKRRFRWVQPNAVGKPEWSLVR